MYPLLTRKRGRCGIESASHRRKGDAGNKHVYQIKEKAEQKDDGDFAAIRHGSSSGEVAYRIGPRVTDKRDKARYTVNIILTVNRASDA